MERLAGSDAGFLFIESESQTSTCVDVAVLAPPADDGAPLTREDVVRLVGARLPLVPSLRWRLERIPLGINHPVWVDDPDFDLEHHVRQVTAAAPGGEAELDAVAAAALPELLDLRHPAWQLVLVDGLADGRQALLFKFHHALADGAGLIGTLDALLGTTAAPSVPAAPAPPLPRRAALFFAGLFANLRAWLALPVMLARTISRFRAVEKRRAVATEPTPKPMNDAPGSLFNPGPTPDRCYGRTRLALADVQRIKRAAAPGTTLSDVLLAVVAGALRAYLQERDGLPDKPLVANVPVADDDPGAGPRQWGNRFANYFSYLATDVADPAERLVAATARNAESKLQLEIQGTRTLSAWLDHIPPALAEPAARSLKRRTAARRDEPDFNVLVSNVRIPEPVWQLGGRRVEQMFMSGPVADESGLNITIVGYGDQLHVSLAANPLALPRPADLIALLHVEVDALARAVVPTTTTTSSTAPAPAPAPVQA